MLMKHLFRFFFKQYPSIETLKKGIPIQQIYLVTKKKKMTAMDRD